jgi:predicted dehydrogenase
MVSKICYAWEMNKTAFDPCIGIAGAGAIVTSSHLPAYTQAGFRVAAIYDRDPARAQAAAAEFAIPHACSSFEELLAHPAVNIVDIAVPPNFQPPMARAAMAAGKHLLCQKPLAWTLSEATALVEEAERAGVNLAVNQQMRWDPMIRATHRLLREGVLGEVINVSLDESVLTDWFQWSWIPPAPQLDLMLHSIHYFDSLRYLFGEPDWVFSTLGKYPKQREVAETRSITILSFPGDMLARVNVAHKNWSDDQLCGWRVEGTEGIIRGRFGHLDNYPYGGPDQMEYIRRGETSWTPVEIVGKWFPDAFRGPMGSLIEAIQTGVQAETNGRDNLKTLALVHACYKSAEEHRMVALASHA